MRPGKKTPDKKHRTGANGAREKVRGREARQARRAARRLTLGRALRIIVFAAAVYGVILMGRPPLGVRLGEPSPQDFKARVSFTSVDVDQTRAAKERAMKREPPVFRAGPERWQAGVQRLLEALRDGKPATFAPYLPTADDRKGFEAVLPDLKKNVDALSKSLAALPASLMVDAGDLEQPLVTDKEGPDAVLVSPSGETQSVPLASFVPLSPDSPGLQAALAPGLEGLQPPRSTLAERVLAAFLAPGASLDMESSRGAAERAADEAPPITKYVEKGRIILARDSEVTSQHLKDLRREQTAYWESWEGRSVLLQHMAGLGVLLVIVLAAGIVPCLRYRPALLDSRLQMLSFGVLSLALVATARICVTYGVTPLWVPLPMMVMTMCLVYDQRFGLGSAVFYALLVRLATPGADMAFLVLLLGGLSAALLTGKVRTRGTLVKSALLIGLVQFITVWGMALVSARSGELLTWQFWDSPYMGESLAALANGVLGGFLVSGLLPAIETIFGVTTDIRLLEWSDPNQPLLQRLLLDAPGTYHHSMIVGSLAADAAEAIGANPLLARVSAYFHDVGKLKKPEYFAENIPAGAHNPHDDLSPTMSTLIITAHPKDGAEMAEQYGVPGARAGRHPAVARHRRAEVLPEQGAVRRVRQRRGGGAPLPLPPAEAAEPRGRRRHGLRRRRGRRTLDGLPLGRPVAQPRPPDHPGPPARRPARRVRPDHHRPETPRGHPRARPGRRLPQPRALPRPGEAGAGGARARAGPAGRRPLGGPARCKWRSTTARRPLGAPRARCDGCWRRPCGWRGATPS